MDTKKYAFILIIVIIFMRFINIYSSLQNTILPYTTVVVQPAEKNDGKVDVKNYDENLSDDKITIIDKDKTDLDIIYLNTSFEAMGKMDVENKMSITELSEDHNDVVTNETNHESEKNTEYIWDPVIECQIDIESFNQYTLEELQHFHGIGEKTAQAILIYESENGNFKCFEDLVLVKGIGEKKLMQLLNGR